MPLATCPRCKRMFNKIQHPICEKCDPEEEKDYERIHAVVAENPGAPMARVAELAGVDVVVVKRMLDQGLVASTALNEATKCGRCGAPAISAAKKLCQACLDKMNLEMAKAQSDMRQNLLKTPVSKPAMHSRDIIADKRQS
jgi:ribosomal protein L37E